MTDEHNPNITSRGAYYSRIEIAADGIEDEIGDGTYPDTNEMIWEIVDSSRPAMYAHEAMSALHHSDSEPVEWKHYVDHDEDRWTSYLTAMGHAVVEQDLREELRDRGFEV